MIAQQLLRLVQELAFVLRSRTFITPSQLPQNLYPCRFSHWVIHSGQSNPTFGATYPFTDRFNHSRVTKLLAQFAPQKNCRLCFTIGAAFSISARVTPLPSTRGPFRACCLLGGVQANKPTIVVLSIQQIGCCPLQSRCSHPNGKS